MTTLSINLPSSPGCPPLTCGTGNRAFLPLKTESVGKSADDTGYLLAEIVTTLQLSATSWRYTFDIEDTEITGGQTVTANDITGQVCCMSCADSALLAKMEAIDPNASVNKFSWQTFGIYTPAQGVVTADAYLFRRHTDVAINQMQIAIASGQGPVTVRLQKTGPNGTAYSDVTVAFSATITGSGIYTARYKPIGNIIIPAFSAVRASITGAADIYTTTAFGLEVNLITVEP